MVEDANILVVDDQPGKLLSYSAILKDLDANLVMAGSAREALDHLLKADFAVVLVDVCMPELDGFELAAMIREHPRFRRTAIIFVSGVHLSDLDRLKGYEYGASIAGRSMCGRVATGLGVTSPVSVSTRSQPFGVRSCHTSDETYSSEPGYHAFGATCCPS